MGQLKYSPCAYLKTHHVLKSRRATVRDVIRYLGKYEHQYSIKKIRELVRVINRIISGKGSMKDYDYTGLTLMYLNRYVFRHNANQHEAIKAYKKSLKEHNGTIPAGCIENPFEFMEPYTSRMKWFHDWAVDETLTKPAFKNSKRQQYEMEHNK